ncbi:hypothetical protein C0J52_09315 [Blattella germanica]|nr:hypothetical protein C0J52_09315 [Blattella germanica]
MVFICRLCGKAENESSGIGIFSEEGVKQSLAYKIKISLDISVYEHDPLPKSICILCLGKLITAFSFQECCRRTQIILRDQYLMSKTFPGSDGLSTNNRCSNISIQNETGATSNWITPTVNSGILLSQPLERNGNSSVPMPAVISTETLAKSTYDSVQSETQVTLCGEPFEFGTFVRSGVLDELVMAVKDGNTKKSNTKNARKAKSKNENSRKKKSVDQTSLLNTDSGPLPMIGQSSGQQSVQVSNISCSSGLAANHESAIVGAISSVPVTTASQNVINNCGVFMGTPNSVPIFTQLQAPVIQDKCDSIKILNVFSVQGEENRSCSVSVPLATLPTNTITTVTNSNSTPFPLLPGTQGIIPVVNMQNASITTPNYMPQPSASTSLPMSFLVSPSISSTASWHSPTPGNSLNSVLTTPENVQNSENRNWHTPSESPAPTSIPTLSQTPTSVEKIKSKDKTQKSNEQPSPVKNIKKSSEEEDDIQVVEVVKANKGSLAQHWEKCESGYMCKECKKSYKKLIKCENHIRTHLGIKPYECSVCNKKFSKRRFLNEHLFNHTGEKLYQCKECPKYFRYRKNLKVHLETTHTEAVSRSYLCEICRKTFNSQYDYWNHKTSKHVIDNSKT